MSKIRIGIVGYGNIGKGVELAIARNEDMELKAVFTKHDIIIHNNIAPANITNTLLKGIFSSFLFLNLATSIPNTKQTKYNTPHTTI